MTEPALAVAGTATLPAPSSPAASLPTGYPHDPTGTDGNGFEDSAEECILPAASDDNFDIRVDVLTWSDATGWPGIVRPATLHGMSLRLRQPFGADTGLRLMPAPYDLPNPGTGDGFVCFPCRGPSILGGIA